MNLAKWGYIRGVTSHLPFTRHFRDHRFFVRQEGHPLANIPLPRAILPPFAQKAEDTNAKRRDPTAHRGAGFWMAEKHVCLHKRWWILIGKPRIDDGMVDEPLVILFTCSKLYLLHLVTIYSPKSGEDALLIHIFWMGLKPQLACWAFFEGNTGRRKALIIWIRIPLRFQFTKVFQETHCKIVGHEWMLTWVRDSSEGMGMTPDRMK